MITSFLMTIFPWLEKNLGADKIIIYHWIVRYRVFVDDLDYLSCGGPSRVLRPLYLDFFFPLLNSLDVVLRPFTQDKHLRVSSEKLNNLVKGCVGFNTF